MEKLKLFISYSHADETHMAELRDHLSVLERSGLLEVWCDRELVVGENLDEEIKSELLSSDLIVFLISKDFLKSYYCYDIELKATLERLPESNIRVVPVIIRDCLWKDTELKKYVAAPKDGRHLKKYNDVDEYWVDVVNSIKIAAEKVKDLNGGNGASRYPRATIKEVDLISKFDSFLKSTQIKLHHKYKDNISLDDIYVFGDLKNIKDNFDELEDVLNSEDLMNISSVKNGALLLGSEQIGKSSLLKKFFTEYLAQMAMPLLVAGGDITTSDIEKIITKSIIYQYEGISKDEYLGCANIKVLLIDDYGDIKLNSRHHLKFLENAKSTFDIIIATADISFKYNEQKYIEFSDFSLYEMLLFGNLRRGELINKWNSLGREETIDDTERHTLNDRAMMHIESIIGKGVVPRKPFYILTILQFLEASTGSDLTLTSYGHCYQRLIQNQLAKVDIGYRDFDIYFNYLEALAFDIFKKEKNYLTTQEYNDFKKTYSKKHIISSHDDVLAKLIDSSILSSSENKLYFGYRYFFYFYAAKYISDNITHCKECKSIVDDLCEKIHSEKNANILIFLVHHSRDKHIIDEILINAYAVFDGVEDAKLDRDETKHLMEYIDIIPSLVLENRDIDEERRKRLEDRDKNDVISSDENNELLDEDIETENLLNDINKSLRLIDLIGQIVRNRYGSLTRDELMNLVQSAYSSGLKLLNMFLELTRTDGNQILAYIENIIEENSELDDEEIAKQARKLYLVVCYGASYSVIRKIAHSIGTDRLLEVFETISDEHSDSPAKQLINIAIKLEFTKQIPKNEIISYLSSNEKNPLAIRLLQETVVQHLYLNKVDFKDRQWISSSLSLQMKSQRLIQLDSAQKK